MSDEQEHVDAGSETSGEQAAAQSSQEEKAAADAGGAVEPKAGDACTCPDGRPGTLHDQQGTLVCLANQG
jgi:hypothetical protein